MLMQSNSLGIKHLIECHCTLKIYSKNIKDIHHKFPVYSKFDKNKKIIPKIVKCNNCEALHNITEVCRSELMPGLDQTEVTLSISDMQLMIPDKLSNLLIKHKCDISTWEQIVDIYENSLWGQSFVIKRDIIDEYQYLKIVHILGENKFKIESKKINDILIL